MTIIERITALAQRVAQEFKTLIARVDAIEELTGTADHDFVADFETELNDTTGA